ncbi:hypothetical protein EBBID32_32580 [Sphingobium indicum BiD32]|uniref:SpoVT-AbrB domain-containing protein n=1 Tax=Sphingobium indicum BiD32 TaxID=1301087 RepID=N1MPN5_9SPHN|nr:AbrB/MazE/SpoVT family DNA-binding domain-containing protein [Sphingobium indicum]CCW18901.1 hypothetical protein EBBID32_32580 [Sphingobium indicum BiD32]
MQTVVRKMGNSAGIILPKALLGEMGLTTGQALDIRAEDGRIVATPVALEPRAGWAGAAQAIGADRDAEAQDWAGFAVEGDADLTW